MQSKPMVQNKCDNKAKSMARNCSYLLIQRQQEIMQNQLNGTKTDENPKKKKIINHTKHTQTSQ